MEAASLLAKVMDKPDGRMRKAIVLSVALHLALMMLIQPARQGGAVGVVLQARIVAAPAKPATTPSDATTAESDLPARSAAERPIPANAQTAPVAAQAQPASPPPETVAGGSERAAPDDAAGSGGWETVPTGPASGLPEIPVMLDTQWYTARQVDRRPELLTPALPAYPEEARRQGIQGSVVIEVHIDEYGEVREIGILEANPPGVFDAAVLEVYGKARFNPAMLNGRPVRYIGKYRVLFELD